MIKRNKNLPKLVSSHEACVLRVETTSTCADGMPMSTDDRQYVVSQSISKLTITPIVEGESLHQFQEAYGTIPSVVQMPRNFPEHCLIEPLPIGQPHLPYA